QSRAEGSDSLKAAFTDVKYILDARLRTEDVDQDPIVNEAGAPTLRLRLGLETAKAWNTVLLVEGEAVMPLEDNYRPDPLQPINANYPVVAAPESYDLNPLQLVNTSISTTTLTLCR